MSALRVRVPEKPDWFGKLRPGDGSAQHRLDELLPPGHQRYLRLFHPFIPWGADPSRVAASERRTWEALAGEVGVELHGTLQWDTLRPVLSDDGHKRPYEVHTGELEPMTRQALFRHLSTASPKEPACFLYELAAIVTGRDPVMVEACVSEFESVFRWADETEAAVVSTPEYIWPSSGAWIVCCDYDLDSTYIAAHDELAASLLGDSSLEVVEVNLSTRVDHKADADQRPE